MNIEEAAPFLMQCLPDTKSIPLSEDVVLNSESCDPNSYIEDEKQTEVKVTCGFYVDNEFKMDDFILPVEYIEKWVYLLFNGSAEHRPYADPNTYKKLPELGQITGYSGPNLCKFVWKNNSVREAVLHSTIRVEGDEFFMLPLSSLQITGHKTVIYALMQLICLKLGKNTIRRDRYGGIDWID